MTTQIPTPAEANEQANANLVAYNEREREYIRNLIASSLNGAFPPVTIWVQDSFNKQNVIQVVVETKQKGWTVDADYATHVGYKLVITPE